MRCGRIKHFYFMHCELIPAVTPNKAMLPLGNYQRPHLSTQILHGRTGIDNAAYRRHFGDSARTCILRLP